jgi:hypothetical protein
MDTVEPETVRQHLGVDGFICWCCICGQRIVRKGHEHTLGITQCFQKEKFIGYGHTACAESIGPERGH